MKVSWLLPRTPILYRNEKLCSGCFVQGIPTYHRRSLKLRVQTSNCFMDINRYKNAFTPIFDPLNQIIQGKGGICFFFEKKAAFVYIKIKSCQLSLQRDCSIVVKDCRRIDTF